MKGSNFERFVHGVVVVLGLVGVGIGLLMTFGIGADIIMRDFFSRPIPGMLELIETLLVAIVFLCLAVTDSRKEHVTLDLFVPRIPKKYRFATSLIAEGFVLAFLLFFFVLTAQQSVLSIQSDEYKMGGVAWRLWPARLTMPLGLLAFLLVRFVTLRGILRKRHSGE